MSGKPRRRALVAELDARTAATFAEDDTPRTHLDFVCRWLEDGKTLRALCAELTPAVRERWRLDTERGDDAAETVDITAATLMSHLTREFGPDTTDNRLAAARRLGAVVLSDESLEIVDGTMETTVDVSHAALRVKQRQWTAEKFNPEQFAAAKGTSITLNIGQLHLDALRAFPARPAPIAVIPAQTARDNGSDKLPPAA